ncbi:UvrB/UvrC motif-containing protein [Clostridium paridis]|uniref:UvrB/UvrC motif-containing protein n=1 Tax=Clostridium paridis TaxID=2803863 RepID=A0A937FFL8_9CLOT|nr:UvrB/UvrC motif-containing protein [Clostridium paridis]MBL4930676.1 UvrB/UvrC motif-containing protein [Clostridium paridis]
MLCERCNKNEATVHMVKIINGNKSEVRLCEKCAADISDIPVSTSFEEFDGFPLQSILGGLVDYYNKNTKTQTESDIYCKKCGMAYNEFKKTGLLGCSECYESFSKSLSPIIKRVQGDVEHIGKIPEKCGKEILERNKILKLKEELQKVILAEEYERAAEIRDEIKILQDKLGE